MDCSAFRRVLEPALGSYGYRGHHTPKLHGCPEGVALFFRAEDDRALGAAPGAAHACFDEVHFETVAMAEAVDDPAYADLFAPLVCDAATADILRTKVNTVGQLALLTPSAGAGDASEAVVVVNTHFYYHPAAPHIRNVHCAVLLRAAQRLIEARLPGAALAFCGDLNSTPETGVVELLLTGQLSSAHKEWTHGKHFRWHRDGDQPERSAVDPEPVTAAGQRRGNLPVRWATRAATSPAAAAAVVPGGGVSHPFRFSTAHALDTMVSSATNYMGSFSGYLDYVLVARGLYVSASQPPLPEAQLAQHTALPSPLFPSDHVPVAVECRFAGEEQTSLEAQYSNARQYTS